jgi:anthranilate phosphoribosyltransferase
MFAKLLKEVGRGKRGARDLSYEEARMAAEMIVAGKVTPAQLGAFFVAERIKMESVEELQAFVEVLREHAYRVPVQEGIDCTGPYDGRKKSFYATFATAFLTAAAGLPVTLHGTAPMPPKWGITLQELLQEAGVSVAEMSRDSAAHAAKETGVLYASSEQWCPPLAKMRPIRLELDMRTIINTAEKLVDYSHSPYLLFGVFHNTVFERMAKLSQNLSYRKALIVQGVEGSEDLFIERPTRTYDVSGGEATLYVINPDAYGLETAVPEITWTPREQLNVTEAVLQGKGHLAFVNQVLLNAAVRLQLAEKVESVEEGLYICKALMDEGAPFERYRTWLSLMQKQGAHTV